MRTRLCLCQTSGCGLLLSRHSPLTCSVCRCAEWRQLAWNLLPPGAERLCLLLVPRGGNWRLGTRWPSSPPAPASSWGTGTACKETTIWSVQWKHTNVDLTGIEHRCPSKGQSSLTGLVRGRQKTHRSRNKQGHGPFVSMRPKCVLVLSSKCLQLCVRVI